MSRMNLKQKKMRDMAMRVLDQNPALAILFGCHREGMMLCEIATELAKVCEGVRRANKPGKLSIELEITPNNGDSSQIFLADKITSKIPRPSVKVSAMHIDGNNLPVFGDPAQAELEDLELEEREPAKEIED